MWLFKNPFDNFIKEDDFKIVKDCGIDHIRIPIDYTLFMDEDYNFVEDGFNRIKSA